MLNKLLDYKIGKLMSHHFRHKFQPVFFLFWAWHFFKNFFKVIFWLDISHFLLTVYIIQIIYSLKLTWALVEFWKECFLNPCIHSWPNEGIFQGPFYFGPPFLCYCKKLNFLNIFSTQGTHRGYNSSYAVIILLILHVIGTYFHY